MQENIKKILLERRTIRQYSNKIISDEILNTILEAGVRASNCGNMQIYSIIVTKDETKKRELAKFHFNQPMVTQASVVLTVCVDVNRFEKWCRLRNAEPSYLNFLWFNIGTIDATIASQAMCVAAESYGIGICYLGTVTYMAKQIAEFLKLPKGVVPITTITLGYPAENPPLTERLPVEAVIHNEEYHDYSDNDIEKIYSDFENLPQSNNYVEENKQENLAQVFTNCRYKKEDSLSFGQSYFEFIKEQGFF
ncbi:MAG: nitroreductase family protein [Bacteroidales bacterium]|jgi:nitroreductase|nr:nitroreductase family protein [Bacteroidales bacterium]